MRDSLVRGLLVGFIVGAAIPGCGVFTIYQHANVLPTGNVASAFEIGGGGTADGPPLMLDLGPAVRVGVGKDIDIGVRPALLYADVKYQFMKGPRNGAFDLGVSYFPTTNAGYMSSDHISNIGLYPAVLFSSGRYFYGARLVYLHQVREGRTEHHLMPGGVFGLSLGRRFRFVPGIGLYYHFATGGDHDVPFAFGLGFGLEYELGRRD